MFRKILNWNFSLFLVALFMFDMNSVYADFLLDPAPLRLIEKGEGIVSGTHTGDAPATYRVEIQTGVKDIKVLDLEGNNLTSFTLNPGEKKTFKVVHLTQAVSPYSNYLIAFDTRPEDKLFTGNLVYIRQGLNVYVFPATKTAVPAQQTHSPAS